MHHNRPNIIKYCTNYIIANFYLCKQAFFLLTISAEVFEMAFCINCGQRLQEGAKFCANCGKAVNNNSTAQRKITYEGEVHKCPNCGAVVNSFIANCPACGYEFRGTKASNAIKEFASKLENIETKREYEKPRGLFAKLSSQQTISKADEQKISLIESFPVPNTKEDMLEFMILATSSMRMSVYDSTNNTISKGEKESEREWDIQRAFWVDKVLEEADYNDVHLEYTPSSDIDNANESQQETSDGGFFEGLNNGIQSDSKQIQENIDEFNRIMDDRSNNNQSGN